MSYKPLKIISYHFRSVLKEEYARCWMNDWYKVTETAWDGVRSLYNLLLCNCAVWYSLGLGSRLAHPVTAVVQGANFYTTPSN